ncbi:MAG: thiamine phosphate synthase [Sphingomonadaceae bacterium]
MPRKQRLHRHLPHLWLMTDERLERLLEAIAQLPRGSGIVFRHYRTPGDLRRQLLAQVQAAARRGGHLLLVAEPPAGLAVPALHLPSRSLRRRPIRRVRLVSAAVHDSREIARARKAGAGLLFLSPLRETRSHPGARHLGPFRFAALARTAGLPVIALGGVGPADLAGCRRLGAHGVAGISCFAVPQGRAAVRRRARLRHKPLPLPCWAQEAWG